MMTLGGGDHLIIKGATFLLENKFAVCPKLDSV